MQYMGFNGYNHVGIKRTMIAHMVCKKRQMLDVAYVNSAKISLAKFHVMWSQMHKIANDSNIMA